MTASAVRVGIPLIGAAYGLVLLSSIVGQVGAPIRLGGLPAAGFRTLDLVIALSLVVAAGVTWIGGGSRRVALLATITGLAWLGPYLVLAPASPTLVRQIAVGLAPLWPVVVLHLVSAATSHGRRDAGRMRILLGLYAIAAVLSVARLVTFDPFFEPDCVPLCNAVPAIFEPPDGSRPVLRQGVHLISLAAGAALASWSFRDLSSGRSLGRDGWTLVGGVLGGGAIIGLALIGLVTRSSIRSGGATTEWLEIALLWILTAGMLSISLGLVLTTIAVQRMRVQLRRVADDIAAGPPPGSLQAALATALGDPSIRVGYWLVDDRRYVDPGGEPFEPSDSDPERVATSIERDGTPVAIVTHLARSDVGELRGIGPSMLMALDNERLQATSLAHLRDLQASRSRLVEASDAERRRIERDLHDGAQQGLLAVSFDLRVARLDAERRGETGLADRLASAETISLEAVEGLRRVARGVHPAVLTQAGLIPALELLGDGSRIPLEVHSDLSGRPPAATEAAAYQIAVDALADATHRGAKALLLRVGGDASHLVLDAIDDGTATIDPGVRVSDRVGASGGDASITRGPDGRGNALRVVLPCG